jgi:hypothetical protein
VDGVFAWKRQLAVLLNTRPGPAADDAGMAEHLQLHLGQVSLRSWSSSAGCWVARWSFPSDCTSSAFFCCRFDICTSAGTYACVDRFKPSKPCEWQHGYFVDGCTTRSHPLSCTADDSGRRPTTEQDDSFLLLDNLRGLPYSSIPQWRAILEFWNYGKWDSSLCNQFKWFRSYAIFSEDAYAKMPFGYLIKRKIH